MMFLPPLLFVAAGFLCVSDRLRNSCRMTDKLLDLRVGCGGKVGGVAIGKQGGEEKLCLMCGAGIQYREDTPGGWVISHYIWSYPGVCMCVTHAQAHTHIWFSEDADEPRYV